MFACTWGSVNKLSNKLDFIDITNIKLIIRNDFEHHIRVRVSQDKVLFNKLKKKYAIGVEASADVGITPVSVQAGAAFNKSTEVEKEDMIYQDIQVAGFTRVERGTEMTFSYNKVNI